MKSNLNEMKEIKVKMVNDSPEIKPNITIEIPFEEYKELLITKGRYEELKSQQTIPWTVKPNGTTITYTNTRDTEKDLTPPYQVTC